MTQQFNPTRWENWADEYLLYMRALNAEHTIIEIVREKPIDLHRIPDGITAYRHEVVFLDDYLTKSAENTLEYIITEAGYSNLEDFIKWIGGQDADTSIEALTNEMKMNLALLIVEHNADRYNLATDDCGSSIVMSRKDAVARVHEVIGYNETVSSHEDVGVALNVRHATCGDCAFCNDPHGMTAVGPFCASCGVAVDPAQKAFSTGCNKFRYAGSENCYCVRSKSEETKYNAPVAFVVVSMPPWSIMDVAAEMKTHRLLELSNRAYDLLEFHPWDEDTQQFSDEPAEDSCHATCLLLRKVDEALRHYGNDVVSVDLNEETGMLDINLCSISSSDYYALGVAAEDGVDTKSLIDGLFVRNVGYTFDE